jgi:DNA-binding response OmpR family regulator
MTPAPSRCLVLLLDDDAIVGIAVEDELVDAGYRVAGPFATCKEALRWLESETPDVAILDAMLREGDCRELALELTAREVPFIVYSGAPQRDGAVSEFGEAVWLEKPASSAMLLAALARLPHHTPTPPNRRPGTLISRPAETTAGTRQSPISASEASDGCEQASAFVERPSI